ncbi:related to Cytochrome b-c1 complex subunit 9 [Zygosaccharomyces bailii]|nr:related to Cytochrome b-c1 complex subunit 9 [Zygosaccharomyces bailii ISA1307]SJM81944.1 related to Cytochrome b-c1 complex subunit 9 [Zygosaccharomyces bailii]
MNTSINLNQSFSTLYRVLFKRNSVMVGTVLGCAFVFQAAFDTGVTTFYENHNKGKLWKDVKVQLANAAEDDDDEDDDDE